MVRALTTSRYVKPNTYIGQLINPRPGDFSGEGRLPVAYGKGNRLATVVNREIFRSFLYEIPLTFSTVPPHVATLPYESDGTQDLPVKLYKSNGEVVRVDTWQFQDDLSGDTKEVLIKQDVFDNTAIYYLDYQSTSRDVLDPIGIEGIREVRNIGLKQDQPEFEEYVDYYIPTEYTTPVQDSGNAYPDRELGAIVAQLFAGVAEQTEVTCVADVAGSLDGLYLALPDATGTVGVWFDVDDSGTAEPAHGATRGLEVTTIVTGDDALTVATKIAAALDADAAFSVAVPTTPTLTVVDAAVGDRADGTAGTSTFTVSVSVQGQDASTGTGTIDHNVGASYTHDYNRLYELTVTAAAGGVGTYTATLEWSAVNLSGGNNAVAEVPLNSTQTKPTFSIDEAVPASLTVDLDLGNRIDLVPGAGGFVVGDKYYWVAKGPGLVEVDLRHSESGEIFEVGDTVSGASNDPGSTGTITDATTDYVGDYNLGVAFEVTATSGTAGGADRTATIYWGTYQELGIGSGSFIIDETSPASLEQTLFSGLKFTFAFGAANFVVGDKFSVDVKAPIEFYTAKDDRNYTIDINSVVLTDVNTTTLAGQFSVDTPEGGFGTFDVTATNDGMYNGRETLPDNMNIVFRNMVSGMLTTPDSRHAASDKQTFNLTLTDLIDFSLTQAATDEILLEDVKLDVIGSITGTPNTYYVILSTQPIAGSVSVVYAGGGSPGFTEITTGPYIKFDTQPTDDLVISYRHKGKEPDPGQNYFLTANYIRPDEFYNTLLTVASRDEGRLLLQPAAIDNHLYIANEIAWSQVSTPASVGFVQVKDADGDGIYSITDYREAILSNETSSSTTDHCVLSSLDNLPDILGLNVRNSDPFAKRENLVWVGLPTGTPIGSIDDPDSIVFMARKTLQVYGDSPAHGTRILVGPTEEEVTIKLQDGTDVDVSVDGSFDAWAEACKTAGFTDPSDSILKTNTLGFKTLQTYTESEDLTLGNAGVIYYSDLGSSIFQAEEDITVDKLAPDFTNINAMTQKQDITKVVRNLMDVSLIAQKPSSGEAGVSLVREFLSRTLIGLRAEDRLADWQDDDGNVRKFDPSKDIVVFQDSTDPTQYLFYYNYFVKYIIKRLMGLYTVNTAQLEIR